MCPSKSEQAYSGALLNTAFNFSLFSAVVSSESVAVVLALIGQNGDGDC
jgi:hypothetical protein